MEAVIRFRGAVALLGRFPALAGVDLDVAPGEVVLLQGPNGAGKTTLLRACAGLVGVSDGVATVLGVDLRRDRRAVRSRVGYLGHATGLYDELSVEDNVRFWTRAAGADPADAAAAMAALGLDGRLREVAVGRLSAGQRRRTSLATLLARRPELWLLDEPHAGLDNVARDLVDGLVADAVAAGATVLVASHELDRAEAIAGRVVTVSGGVIVGDTGRPVLGAGSAGTDAAPVGEEGRAVLRDAALVAGKDLRLEARSRVALNQIAPFALLVLILFAFALDPDRGLLARATPGLYWVAVLLCTLLAVQRSFGVEAADGNRDALRLSGLEPAGIFLGKAAAVGVQLLVLEVLLGLGVVVLYNTPVGGWPLLVFTCLVATAGVAAAGTLYGVLAAGLRVRETLLPLLLLPVLAPVLIGSTRAFEAALSGATADGWPWVGLLAVFALVYIVAGALAFGPLLEES